ncbi:TetR family transcriptional regulator [Streptomyces sp. SGAir0957]
MTTSLATRSADGRIPGQRGLKTRQKLVDATIALLNAGSYRNVTVKEIALHVGTSPATFYLYFAGVEDVILEAAAPLVDDTTAALADFEDGTWAADGLPGASRLVDAVLDAWRQHRPVMRVLTAVAAESDYRFMQTYAAVTRPVARVLTAAIVPHPAPGPVPKAVAHSLVATLAAAAGHEGSRRVAGLSNKARREGLAHLVLASVTTAAL